MFDELAMSSMKTVFGARPAAPRLPIVVVQPTDRHASRAARAAHRGLRVRHLLPMHV